jgi:hypothetical protein
MPHASHVQMQDWHILKGSQVMQLELCGLHDRLSHVTPPHKSLWEALETMKFSNVLKIRMPKMNPMCRTRRRLRRRIRSIQGMTMIPTGNMMQNRLSWWLTVCIQTSLYFICVLMGEGLSQMWIWIAHHGHFLLSTSRTHSLSDTETRGCILSCDRRECSTQKSTSGLFVQLVASRTTMQFRKSCTDLHSPVPQPRNIVLTCTCLYQTGKSCTGLYRLVPVRTRTYRDVLIFQILSRYLVPPGAVLKI